LIDLLTPAQWQQLIMSLFGGVGVILISLKRKSGFIWISVSQFLFVLYFHFTDQDFIAIQNVLLILFNIFGYFQWTHKENN